MKKIKFLSIFVIASSLVFVYSCKKDTKEVDTETQSVVDNSICEQEFSQIQPTSNNLAIKTKGTSAAKLANVLGGCDSLTYISGDTSAAGFTNTNPPTFEYNYGTCSLANVDGVARTGKLWIRFIGRPNTVGSKTIIKLINYKVNGLITYSCDSILVTTLTNSVSTKSWNVKIINGVCTGSGWNIKYASDKTITVLTQSTPALSDDEVQVTGTANGTNRDGRDFDVVITNITKPASCKHITKGTVEVTPKDFSKRTVDFGSGACDNQATFTVNGQTIAFTLK